MRKNLKKRIGVSLLSVLFMSRTFVLPVYASVNEGEKKMLGQKYTVTEESNDVLIVNSKDRVERVSIKEDQ